MWILRILVYSFSYSCIPCTYNNTLLEQTYFHLAKALAFGLHSHAFASDLAWNSSSVLHFHQLPPVQHRLAPNRSRPERHLQFRGLTALTATLIRSAGLQPHGRLLTTLRYQDTPGPSGCYLLPRNCLSSRRLLSPLDFPSLSHTTDTQRTTGRARKNEFTHPALLRQQRSASLCRPWSSRCGSGQDGLQERITQEPEHVVYPWIIFCDYGCTFWPLDDIIYYSGGRTECNYNMGLGSGLPYFAINCSLTGGDMRCVSCE